MRLMGVVRFSLPWERHTPLKLASDWLRFVLVHCVYVFVCSYWEADLEGNRGFTINMRMMNATIQYGYEYLGNSSILVITPLTDRWARTQNEVCPSSSSVPCFS